MRRLAVVFLALLSGCGFAKLSVPGGGAGSPSAGSGAENAGSGAENAGSSESAQAGGGDEAARVKAACEAKYKSTYDEQKKESDDLDRKIDAALKEPAVHDRISTLLSLRPRGGDLAFVGAAFRLEQELLKLTADPAKQNAYAWMSLGLHPEDVAKMRPLLSFEKEARWACYHQGERQSEDEVAVATVRYSEDEVAAMEEEMEKAKSLPTEEKDGRVTGLTDNVDFKPPFYGLDTGKVAAIAREGTGGTITFESSREEMVTLGCGRANDRLVIENKTIQYDKSCTYGTKTWVNHVKLTFADLPKVAIEKGDEIKVLAEITDVSVKATQKTGSKQREDRNFAGKGTFVVSVARNDRYLWKLAPDR